MVEVSPAYLYEVDDNFKNAQAQMLGDFTRKFTTEGLCFIGPNDIVCIEGEAEVFHGFWSNILVSEPLTFTWPNGFVPGSHQVSALSWFDNFPPRGLTTVKAHSSLELQEFSKSFTIELNTLNSDSFDIVAPSRERGNDDVSGIVDYALAA